jgi:GntR family transcriptional repressor for pyruvate dehydrogenase complex
MAMESATAGLAAARIDGPGIEMLSRLVAELERCKDSDLLRYSKVDAQFHLGIAKVAGNRFLLKALENISDLLQYQQQQLARVSVLMDTVTSQHQHTEIFEAIRQKNVNLAREAMVRHLSEVTRLWKDELRKHVPPETG